MHAARPAPCSTARRCRAGGPPTKTRSRCAAGAAAPRSSPSRRSSPSIRFSARSACAPAAAASTRWKSAASTSFANSCGCIDHRVNGARHLQAHRRRARGFARGGRHARSARRPPTAVRASRYSSTAAASPRPTVLWPRSEAGTRARRAAGSPLHRRQTAASIATLTKIEALISAWHVAPAESAALAAGVAALRALARPAAAGALARDGARRVSRRGRGRVRASFDLLRHPLLPYQREGMLHLAFGERALLADEMGLGKTIQAIAACELLARRKGIAPRAGGLPGFAQGGMGGADRPLHRPPGALRLRRRVRSGSPPIASRPSSPSSITSRCSATPRTSTTILAPDVVVLDEAQRIKNWQTKTARQVKSLRSPYAFVLTGTPVENRIDELYSIVQYLDPEIARAAVPLQPRLLRARRARPPDRLQEPRRAAAPRCSR